MRKTFAFLALLALALPVAGVASLRSGDGTLTVEDGRGRVSLQARGGVLGRLDRGTVTIFDTTPGDANDPVVSGDDRPVRFVGETGIQYSGVGLRFRVAGGGFRVVVAGRGIDLSVVGKGNGWLVGDAGEPGLYSLDGDDCRKAPASCAPLPQTPTRFQLGADRDKGGGRPDGDG